MKIEETLKGGYKGLYGEVVTNDTYRLKHVKFQPDLIFDIGANIGVFSRYARELFPKAKIIAVEPDPANCRTFRQFTPPEANMVLVEAALGQGQIFHGTTAVNGAGGTYLSAGLGYPLEAMERAVADRQGLVASYVPALRLSQIFARFYVPSIKVIFKIDCEGGENSIWDYTASMDALRIADYIAMELHDYALTGGELDLVKWSTQQALDSLKSTHTCERDGVHFWATKNE